MNRLQEAASSAILEIADTTGIGLVSSVDTYIKNFNYVNLSTNRANSLAFDFDVSKGLLLNRLHKKIVCNS